MTRISLIGTVHQESGHANVSALVAILERIRPEVIFLELPANEFADEYHPAHGHLEPTAIRHYRANPHVTVEPVDLPRPEDDFFRDHDELVRQIERRNHQFCSLMDIHSQNVRADGFTYLNSADCAKFWSDLHYEILEIIPRLIIDQQRFKKHYREWRQTHESRETAMLENIYAYCELQPVDTGIFLVGAAHRQPIIDKIGAHSRATIQWDFPESLGTRPNS